jgi:hypothetical protein
MKNNLKAEIETQYQRREWIQEDVTTFDQKKALVLKPIHDIIGRQIDGSDTFEIRNEVELGAIQAVLVYFYSFHQVIYEDIDSNRSIDREYERYEALQETYIEQARLMSERRGEVLPDNIVEIMTVPYTPPQTKAKGLNVIKEFFKSCLSDAGMERIRAEVIAGKLMDIFGNHAEALHIDHNLQVLFEFDILAPLLIREKEFGINLTKYYPFKS